MRRIAAISALSLAVGFMAFWATEVPAPAQEGEEANNPSSQGRDVTFGTPRDEVRPGSGVGLFSDPIEPARGGLELHGEPFNAEARVSTMVSEFSSALNSALEDKVITEEQANRLRKELELSLEVKRARLDLLRVGMRLDKVSKDAVGVLGFKEAIELRQQLPPWHALNPQPQQPRSAPDGLRPSTDDSRPVDN